MVDPTPTRADIARWRKYYAAECAEAAIYADLASRAEGEQRLILTQLSESEQRHADYWKNKLGSQLGPVQRGDLWTRILGWLAKNVGSVFVFALVMRAEANSPYYSDVDATDEMRADERIHAEVVRALSEQGRGKISGSFRAAIFGINDGLVSNLALVMGTVGAGMAVMPALVTGIAGLISGALSMAAGEYISVKSQRELLISSLPSRDADEAVADLNVDANELALVFRARGLSAAEAEVKATEVFRTKAGTTALISTVGTEQALESVGSAYSAALASLCFFALGAVVPLLAFPWTDNAGVAVLSACVAVSVVLLCTGCVVGMFSTGSIVLSGLRQLTIGLVAAAITYALGMGVGVLVG